MQLSHDSVEKVLVALSVMAPHMASELLEQLLGKELSDCSWPRYNPEFTYETEVEIMIQVNGKLRGEIMVARNAQQDVVETLAKAVISRWLEGKQLIKVIFVKDRLINFVVR
jgi:leucyl-tRNA synthetase